MKKTCITVVIVSYKSAQLTIDSLQSVQQERANNPALEIKVVVLDNASGDAPAVEQAVSQQAWSDWVTVLTAPYNGGFGYGNNYAFHYALNHWSVDYFHLLNPDAQLRPNAMITLVDFLKSRRDVGIVGSSFETQDGKIWPYAFRFPSLLSEFESAIKLGLVTKLLKNWTLPVTMTQVSQEIDWVAGASMMIKRELVEHLRGFDESFFLYYEETDFCLRAKRAGFSTWYVPDSRVMHILGQSTKVTELTDQPKRLPAYWFESRINYLVKNQGILLTVLIDIVTITAYILSSAKRLLKKLLGKSEVSVPYYLTDLMKHSPIFPMNWELKPFASPLPAVKSSI